MTDDLLVERLLMAPHADFYKPSKWFELMTEAAVEIERLKREVAEWKERWAAERRDHEATIRQFDRLMNEVT